MTAAGPLGAAELIRSVGLLADGPAPWGRPIAAQGPGVYVVELPSPPDHAPLELATVGKWLERSTELRLDGRRPTSRELRDRLASFWLPGQPVLFVGSSAGSVGGRVLALERTLPGARRPFAAGVWLNLLQGLDRARIWWASTDAPDEYEDALLDAFAAALPPGAAAATPQPDLVMPWGVLRRPTGERRAHGLTGMLVPEGAEPDTTAPAPRAATRAARSRPPAARATRSRADRGTPAEPAGPGGQEAAPVDPASVPGVDHMSAEGLERLERELVELRTVRRPAVVDRVATAREHGDLKENAEYHAAREELGFVDGRIAALEDRIRRAVVVDGRGGDVAAIGSDLVVETDGERLAIRLVGSAEADAGSGRISVASPVGRALLGSRAGDDVVVATPGGEIRYRVLEVG
jgi:transcription elongation factor GreA